MKYVPNYPDMDNLFPYPKISNIEPPKYEERKTPYELLESQSAYLEKTSKELHDMAESAKSQADSAKEIAESSKVQANTALKTSSKADIKGWIAVIISILAFAWSIISHFI